jgi:replicative DNA helicase
MARDGIETEQSLLGAILLDPSRVLPLIADKVAITDFVETSHRHVYKAILALYEARTDIDVITLSIELRAKGALDAVGGSSYLVELQSFTPTSYHAESYATSLMADALKRKIKATAQAIEAAVDTDKDADLLLQQAEGAIFAIGKERTKDAVENIGTILATTITRIETAQAGNGPTGVSTGYREMDAILTGLMPSDLIVLAARPSMGKTAFALNLAAHVGIAQDVPTLIFSLEMGREQLVDRLVSMETGIPTERLRTGKLSASETKLLRNTAAVLSEAPVYIDDTPNLTVSALRTRARREDHLHKLGLIVVDYLQLMSGGGKLGSHSNREQEISEISRGLKIVARELRIPVIALSQLSRQVESRDVKIPQLSDLRESGSIEQNADIVAFLYRDDYYNTDSKRKNMTDVLIRKHRNGRLGAVELYFDREHQKFRGVSA